MEFQYFSRNGEIVPIAEATIPLSNIEYTYGFGVYETMRVTNGVLYFLKNHVERLMASAQIIGLEHPFDVAFLEKSIMDLVGKTDAQSYNLKLLLIGAAKKEGAMLCIICLNPLFPDKKLYRDGASFVTYEYERAFPHSKSLNMLESYMAYRKAKAAGAYDALLINCNGCITEGTRTNFYCIKDRMIVSPPENEILIGVTRTAVLEVARKNNFTVEERGIALTDLKNYDGAFITSTSSKIIPVRSIDDQQLSIPPALIELMKLFDEFLASCGGKMD